MSGCTKEAALDSTSNGVSIISSELDDIEINFEPKTTDNAIRNEVLDDKSLP